MISSLNNSICFEKLLLGTSLVRFYSLWWSISIYSRLYQFIDSGLELLCSTVMISYNTFVPSKNNLQVFFVTG